MSVSCTFLISQMNMKKIESNNLPFTALLYCKAGVGKSTAIGLIAEKSKGNTLVLDIDRTIMRTLAKGEIVKDTSRVLVEQVENRGKNDAAGINGALELRVGIDLADIALVFVPAVENIHACEIKPECVC